MILVCGVDFSPASASLADVAGGLAQRLRAELVLVHVLELDLVSGALRESLRNAASAGLDREADRLRAAGIRVSRRVLEGKPDQQLSRLAAEEGAAAVVISALGSRSGTAWQLGGRANRIAQHCESPVLVLRDPEPFLLWLDGRRPLRVLAAVDRTRASRQALAFVRILREAAPIDLSVVHVYWAPEENERLGYAGGTWVEPNPEVEAVLRRDLEGVVRELSGGGASDVAMILSLGRASDRILEQASKRRADLLVLGSHQRNFLDRMWNGSTSRQVLHDADCSVTVVTSLRQEVTEDVPRVESVLVATDFSDTGDGAVRWAYGLAGDGGVVHLIHVKQPAPTSAAAAMGQVRDILAPPASPTERAEIAELERMLRARIPRSAAQRGVTTDVRVVRAAAPATGILQAAERLGVDAIVVGTSGKTGVALTVLGSVAQEVANRSPRPVMLVHPPPK
ncbi:MAG: universal stress protein [Myxococcaceae bacterium]|nr:universal stress protein [Myxococcaceae bacterium]